MSPKKQIRNKMRRRRQNLSSQMRMMLAKQFTEHFVQSPLFKSSKRIACYMPNDGELDLQYVIRQIWKMNKTCYLPILSDNKFQKLLFAPFEQHTELKKNKYGIPEPIISSREATQVQNLDLVLIPLVAFDRDGNRIGMGGGFYDKTLSFMNQRKVWLKPNIYGVAYEFQQVSPIKKDPWDIPMHGVLSEIKQYDMAITK